MPLPVAILASPFGFAGWRPGWQTNRKLHHQAERRRAEEAEAALAARGAGSAEVRHHVAATGPAIVVSSSCDPSGWGCWMNVR